MIKIVSNTFTNRASNEGSRTLREDLKITENLRLPTMFGDCLLLCLNSVLNVKALVGAFNREGPSP